jgi:hypothetical protein
MVIVLILNLRPKHLTIATHYFWSQGARLLMKCVLPIILGVTASNATSKLTIIYAVKRNSIYKFLKQHAKQW